MTEQQKAAIEAQADNVYYPTSEDKIHYMNGMNEILNNPSKYGLQPINEWVSVINHNLSILEKYFTDIYDGLERPSRHDGLSALNFVKQCNEKGLYIVAMGYKSYLEGKRYTELWYYMFEGGFAAMPQSPINKREEE